VPVENVLALLEVAREANTPVQPPGGHPLRSTAADDALTREA